MKTNFTPDSRNPHDKDSPYWDNSALLAKVLYRFRSHGTLFLRALRKGASTKRLLITRAPYLFADSVYPPSMHVELTNACDLRCLYCNNPHFAHPRGMMNERTVDDLITGLRGSQIDRLCMGGGEPTLHPRFAEIASRLRKEVRILTIVTNGHWTKPDIAEALVTTPVDFIEVSVEAGTPEDFEMMRVGGDHGRVLENLKRLKALRDQLRSPSLINLRMMVRPSQRGLIENRSRAFWSPYADTLMPQYVLKDREVATIDDAYTPRTVAEDSFPKCGLPFRNLQVRYTGDVPLCQLTGSSLDPKKRLMAGHVGTHSLQDIWNGDVMRNYRLAHRTRNEAMMPVCKGCVGC